MKKKRWLVLFFILILPVTMIACSNSKAPSNADSGSSDGKIELTFWTFGTTGYEKLIPEYEKQHPNIKIKMQNGEFNDHHNKLFTAISAGSGAPDLAMIEVGFIEKYRDAQDRFYNLYDFGAGDLKSKYLEWKWSIGESADRKFLFGLPTDIGPTVMYYRTDIFEKAGLPVDPKEVAEKIKTWDDYTAAAKQVKEKTGKPMTDNVELIYNARRDQAPEAYFDRQDQLIIEKSPYAKKAYDYTVQLIKEGVVGDLNLWTPEWNGSMKTGGYATLLAPSWMNANIKGNAPNAKDKWAIAPMPEGAGNWGGSYIAIPKESKHAKEAYEFAKWLVSPENQLKSFKDAGLFPSAPELYSNPEFNDYKDEYFYNDHITPVFAEAAKKVKVVYTGKNFQLVQGEIIRALQNVQKKKADPESEWKAAIDRIKTQLARQ
ncbi:ABC transporter substrate-binding protein [Lihuaxuella thermophila]|uniref:Cellobiose transport system substrate-binding protein n=1 Tax=Lihuaxuella thermophila TaxID=1173111 RepID=A0A1H8FEB4_9BACL|nr:extracellular solute-binding protein [Lihuaxuella thermophila]SEN29946.1 cellobiose transport system substrate-binding protein [Lihuaxuella thermophila]